MGKLEGKVAVVTGAGSGMGRASAVLFAQQGARVVCADVSGDEQSTAAEIGDRAIGLHVDVSKAADVQNMMDTAVRTFGKLDVVYNNAGLSGPHALLDQTDDEVLDQLYAVNLRGVFFGIKYAIPALRANGGGSIISTASVMGLVGRREQAAYSATKGGVVALTKNAAVDYARENIRINCICPGMVYTAMAGAQRDTEDAPDREMPAPMGRWGRAQEIATAALFLASDDSSFITGHALPVDGGYVAE